MPFQSEAQRKFLHANKPEVAKRWEAHTPDKKLPERVGEKRKKKDVVADIYKSY